MPRPVAVRLIAATMLCLPPATAQCTTGWAVGNTPGTGHAVDDAAWWDPDGSGPLGEVLVVTGRFSVAGNQSVQGLAVWDPGVGEFVPFAGSTSPSPHGGSLSVGPAGELVFGGRWQWTGSGWQDFGAPPWFLAPGLAAHLPNGDVVTAHTYFYPYCGLCGLVTYADVQVWNGTTWTRLPGFPGYRYNQATVSDLAVLPNGDVVVVGAFAGGNVAVWDGTSWSSLGSGLNGYVRAVDVMSNGDLVACGSFTLPGGDGVARWNGTSWVPVGGGVTGSPLGAVDLEVMPSGDLVVAGYVTTAGGAPVQGIARWDGASWSSIDGTARDHFGVRKVLAAASGELFAGGSFRSIGGAAALHVARYDGSAWHALAPGFDGAIYGALTRRNGNLVVAGRFELAGTQACRGIAEWDGTNWSPLGSGLVDASAVVPEFALLELPSGDLLVGGDVSQAGGVAVNHIARWDGAAWSAVGAGLPYAVRSLSLAQNGDVIAGVGDYPGPGEVWRFDGVAWTRLGPTADGVVNVVLHLRNGDLLAGGRFMNFGGAPVSHLARWDGTAWSAYAGGRFAAVTALLEAANGDLIAGGEFPVAGLISRWDGTAWSRFGLGLENSSGPAAAVNGLVELPNGDLLATGSFERSPGANAWTRGVARWDGTEWLPVDDGLNDDCEAVTVMPDGSVVVGGRFTATVTKPAAFLARLATDCPASVATLPTACVGPAGPVELAAAALPWVGTTFRSTATGFAANSLGVSLLGLGSPGVPLNWLWSNTLPGCEQLASHEAIQLVLPQGGAANYAFTIPADPVFAGLELFHQFLHFDLDANNNLLTLSSSNGLQLVLGAF
ncbi:MAG: WD40 repeat domain-containing protein [bacterium]|nr:WD40 repeat domain-containing protein [bacterium]